MLPPNPQPSKIPPANFPPPATLTGAERTAVETLPRHLRETFEGLAAFYEFTKRYSTDRAEQTALADVMKIAGDREGGVL